MSERYLGHIDNGSDGEGFVYRTVIVDPSDMSPDDALRQQLDSSSEAERREYADAHIAIAEILGGPGGP